MNALSRAVKAIEETPVSLGQWLAGFTGVLFIRFLLEEFSVVHSISGIAATDAATLVHYVLFFLAAALALIIVISVAAPDKRRVVPKLVLFGLMIVWISPLIDIAVGHRMAYHFVLPNELLHDFMTFFGPLTGGEITLGLRIELALIVLAVFAYLKFSARRSVPASLAGAFAAYALIFVLMALPSVVLALASLFSSDVNTFAAGYNHPAMNYFAHLTRESLVAKNFLHPTLSPYTFDRAIEVRFTALLSQVLYLFLVLLAALYAVLAFPAKLAAVLKNSRPERVALYSLLVAAGMLFGSRLFPLPFALGWNDYLSVVLVFMSFYFAWMYAVGVNDLEDVEIDEVSNASRPLISGTLSRTDIASFNIFFLVMSLAGAYLAGHYALFTLLTFTAAYYIYSARPLKLKRVPGISPFLISIACLSAVMAGFFTLGANPRIAAFPVRAAMLLLAVFALAANMKDLKDVEGDSKAGIRTLAVLLGSRAKRVIGAMPGLSFLLIPSVFNSSWLYLAAFPAAFIAFVLVNRKNFREIWIFALYFAFALAVFVITA